MPIFAAAGSPPVFAAGSVSGAVCAGSAVSVSVSVVPAPFLYPIKAAAERQFS